MAPYTYVGLALGAAPGGRICFENLEFADINGPAPVDGLVPGQALRFGDLDLVFDCLGQLRLSESRRLITDRPEPVLRSSTLMR